MTSINGLCCCKDSVNTHTFNSALFRDNYQTVVMVMLFGNRQCSIDSVFHY